MFDIQYFGGVILFLVIGLAISMFRVLREYERGVIFRLGKLAAGEGEAGPFSATLTVEGKRYPLAPVGAAAQELILAGGLEGWVAERL